MQKILKELKKPFYKKVFAILLVAIVVRLILLPLFIHGDLAAETWRAYQVAFNGNMAHFTKSRFLNSAIHIINVYFTSLFVPNLDKMLPTTGITQKYYTGDTYAQVWVDFLSQPRIYLAVSLFKLPYLIFDLIGAYFITKFFDSKEKKLKALALWLFNPIIIFTAYIWGRYDIILITFLTLSFYFLREKKVIISLIFFGCSILIKSSSMLIAPIYLLYILKQYRLNKWQIIGACSIAAIAFLLVDTVAGLGLLDIVRGNHFQYFMELNFATIHYTGAEVRRTYLFPLIYAFMLLYYFLKGGNIREETQRQSAFSERNFTQLVGYSAVAFLLYYSMCFYHEHYFVWFIPFIIILWDKIEDVFFIHLLQCAVFLFTFMFKADFLFSKFVPWGRSPNSWPIVLEKFFEGFIYRSAIHIGPTILSVFAVYLIVAIVANKKIGVIESNT